jgi:RNA polymerase sigma-70 factor (ECF subfamily)
MKPVDPIDPSKPRVELPRGTSGPPADEPALIERCRGGDTSAYRILVERYRDRVYRLAVRILRSEPDAEEVAQDAFVRAWLALAEFRGEAAFSTWIYRIATRRALDRAAILKGRRARETTLEDAKEPSVEEVAPDRDSRRIAELVDALPEVPRSVISLFYFGEYSVAEVGRILGMPEGTVKTHLARARAVLRQEWLRRERLEALDEV